MMFFCYNCGKSYEQNDLTTITQNETESWGVPVFETWQACPECKSDARISYVRRLEIDVERLISTAFTIAEMKTGGEINIDTDDETIFDIIATINAEFYREQDIREYLQEHYGGDNCGG